MDTNEFGTWFCGSVVVDSNKQPLLVYHGTINEFNVFKTKPEDFTGWSGWGESMLGASFSESKEVAMTYPPSIPLGPEVKRRVISAYLKIIHPIKFRSLNGLRESLLNFMDIKSLNYHPLSSKKNNAMKYRRKLEDEGYDGITFLEGYSFSTQKGKSRVWMAFYPEQIYSVKVETIERSKTE